MAESEKAQEEAKKVKEEALNAQKQRKGIPQAYINLLAPILTAATLLFTLYQFNKNNEQQRIANEETEWREFTKQLQNNTTINRNLTIIPTLTSFLNSDRFGSQARELTYELLPGIVNSDKFEYLFSEISRTKDINYFEKLPRLSKALTATFSEIERQVKKDSSRLKDSSHAIKEATEEKLKTDLDLKAEVDKELSIVADAIIDFIKKGDWPPGYVLSLKGTYFFKNDLSGLSLSNVDITQTQFESCDVSSANFENVSSYEFSTWNKTVWWRASKLSTGLSKYLIDYFPYNPKIEYFNGSKKDSLDYIKFLDSYKKEKH